MNTSTDAANETDHLQDDMAKQPKVWVNYIVIIVCVIINQAIAYLASPSKLIEERKYYLNIIALYTIAVQWIVFLHAGGIFGNQPTEKFYDLAGSLTYISTLGISLYLSYVNDHTINARQIILSVFVLMWSARLGWFLFARIHSAGIDDRFTAMKKIPSQFLMAWTVQGVWVFLVMLPLLMLNLYTEFEPFGVFDYIGMPTWVIGFAIEVVADYQKSAFRKIVENKTKWIASGLWSISRHPNYFGEIVLWLGVALACFGGLGAKPRAAYAFISPVFVAFLLIFVSGIPLLEQKADKKFGENPEYQTYKKETPVLVPFIGRAGDAMF